MNSVDAMSTSGLGGGGGGMGMSNNLSSSSGGNNTVGNAFGLSVNPNQHYEMLKLHHMNLLNEIQETTLMMNLYQQQHMQQQQQQQLQQQMGGNNTMSRMGFDVRLLSVNDERKGRLVVSSLLPVCHPRSLLFFC